MVVSGTHNEEGMVSGAEDPVLGLCMGHFVLLDNHFLLQDLDRVQLGSGLFAAQDDLTKGTLAQHLQELKVFKCLEEIKEQLASS